MSHKDQARIEDLSVIVDRLTIRLEEVTKQRDVAIKHIADWCIAIDVNGGGWDDWDDYYKDAFYREQSLPEIRELLVDAFEVARKQRASW